jgi:hypothetical protein
MAAVKHLIARGIGFSPGSVRFIPGHGLATAVVSSVTSSIDFYICRRQYRSRTRRRGRRR